MARLTEGEARKLNNDTPENQSVQLGSKLRATQKLTGEDSSSLMAPVLYINYAVTADATSGLTITSNLPFAIEILDVIVQCTTANALGTLKLTDGTNDITDAMVCAVDKVIVRAGTIDDAYSGLAAASTIKVVANGAADRGTVTILARRTD